MRPVFSTVAGRSRSAYRTRSAGTSFGVWLTMDAPQVRRTDSNSASESAVGVNGRVPYKSEKDKRGAEGIYEGKQRAETQSEIFPDNEHEFSRSQE